MSDEAPIEEGPPQEVLPQEPPQEIPPITLADILAATEVVRVKEQTDKAAIETIGSQSFESLKAKLIQWGILGFPNVYPILTLSITPPTFCSDGVARNLADYITFCSGKPIQDHMAVLQAKLRDMVVSYANFGHSISVVVSKA